MIIVSDDNGYDEFSLNESPRFSAPRIDSIASQAVLFTEGYTSETVCSLTRAGLLTGRYQNQFGHTFNIAPVAKEEARPQNDGSCSNH